MQPGGRAPHPAVEELASLRARAARADALAEALAALVAAVEAHRSVVTAWSSPAMLANASQEWNAVGAALAAAKGRLTATGGA
jgi:hypothetical protein